MTKEKALNLYGSDVVEHAEFMYLTARKDFWGDLDTEAQSEYLGKSYLIKSQEFRPKFTDKDIVGID